MPFKINNYNEMKIFNIYCFQRDTCIFAFFNYYFQHANSFKERTGHA